MVPIKGYLRIDSRIDWTEISENESPEAIRLLEEFPEKINWYRLSANSFAIEMLKEHPDKIKSVSLSLNFHPEAVRIIKDLYNNTAYYPFWNMLSTNPFATDWLIEIGQIQVPDVYRNPSQSARVYIETQNQSSQDCNLTHRKIRNLVMNQSCWAKEIWERCYKRQYQMNSPTSANPYFADMMLTEHFAEIDWKLFSMNPSPIAVHYLLDNPDKIRLRFAESNPHPSMTQYVLDNLDRDPLINLSRNTCPLALHYLAPVIYDYESMKLSRNSLHKELIEVVLSPDYLLFLSQTYAVDFKELALDRSIA